MKTPRYEVKQYGANLWYVADTIAGDFLPGSGRKTQGEALSLVRWLAEGHDRSGAQELRQLLERLLKTVELLYQNSEGCVVNHFAQDFKEQGLPGFLIDCGKDIEEARTALAATSGEGEIDTRGLRSARSKDVIGD